MKLPEKLSLLHLIGLALGMGLVFIDSLLERVTKDTWSNRE